MILDLGRAPFNTQFNFTIPDVDNIGLFLAGGCDSTILLCMIIEELKNTHRTLPIHIWICNKPPDTYNAARIADVISQEYNQDLIIHDDNTSVSKSSLAKGQMDFKSTRNVAKQFDSIELYMGANNSWEKTQWADKMDQGLPTLSWSYPEETHVTYPFLWMLKSQMIDIFYKLNKEHLIKYTYSCSQKEHPRCNKCYSCIEAQTGFNMLNKIRPEFLPL